MERTRILVLLILALSLGQFVTVSVTAEVLAPPPLSPQTGANTQYGNSWLMLKRISDSSGSPKTEDGLGLNYIYDLGGDFSLFGWQNTTILGMVRMMFISEQPKDWSTNTWLIDSSAVVIEQYIRVGYTFSNGTWVSLGFHHNSKHDLDRTRRRTPIHDTLRLDVQWPIIQGDWGFSPWFLGLSSRMEYALEPVFQFDAPEPYKGGLFLDADFQPVQLPNGVDLFTSGRLSVIRNEVQETRFTDVDWLIRGGLRYQRPKGGVSLFGEIHRLHDDWLTRDSIGPERPVEPWTLVSLGILIWR